MLRRNSADVTVATLERRWRVWRNEMVSAFFKFADEAEETKSHPLDLDSYAIAAGIIGWSCPFHPKVTPPEDEPGADCEICRLELRNRKSKYRDKFQRLLRIPRAPGSLSRPWPTLGQQHNRNQERRGRLEELVGESLQASPVDGDLTLTDDSVCAVFSDDDDQYPQVPILNLL